jgi:sugar-specific transcriptional regulator TrmB
MQNTLIQKLKDAGLEEKEAIVYIAILELGEATIAKIVRKSAIKRSTVYDILEKLKKIGMISQTNKGKRPIFLAESPEKLIESLETKKRTLQESMPELLSMMNLLDKKPRIRYFEGLSGVKEVFEATLRYSDQEILTWFPYPYINLGEDYFWKHYMPERIKKKIWARAIVPDTPKNREFAKEIKEKAITTTKFVSDNAFSGFDLEIKVYGKNKLGIISYKEDLGIIIESQKIYDGMKAIFEGMWNLLPESKSSKIQEDLTENTF